MMTAEQPEAEFGARGTLRGGILILRPDEAIAPVRRARDTGSGVLGLDAFQITGTSTQPLMEHSTDYPGAGALPRSDTWAEAERFLSTFRRSTFVSPAERCRIRVARDLRG